MDPYIQLAKNAVEFYVKKGRTFPIPEKLTKEMVTKQAGVFVTLYKKENLRGCIGTFLPTKENIAQEIIDNAISACSRDYRFNPISVKELADLRYEVSILSKPKSVQNRNTLNCKKHGIIVKSGHKIGLLLPDLDGINSVNQQIEIACQKANINQKREPIELYSFLVEKHI